MKRIILLITSVLIFFLISTNAQSQQHNFNSSKSNTSTVGGQIPQSKLDQVLAEIDKIGSGITKSQVQSILGKLRIKGIKKIVITKRKGKVEVLLLAKDDKANLLAAKKAVKFKAGADLSKTVARIGRIKGSFYITCKDTSGGGRCCKWVKGSKSGTVCDEGSSKMNKAELVEAIASDANLSKAEVRKALDAFYRTKVKRKK